MKSLENMELKVEERSISRCINIFKFKFYLFKNNFIEAAKLYNRIWGFKKTIISILGNLKEH